MAGDWIKMRNNLWDDPRVSSLCDITGLPEAMVIGCLYWLWATADEHSEDGHMPGLSVASIDRKTGCKGFGAGLLSIGWIEDSPGGITILRFDEHNGASAKRRCTEAQRKANSRTLSASDADNHRTTDGQIPPNCGAREEKRREEQEPPLPSGVLPPEDLPPESRRRATRKCPPSFVVTAEMVAWASERATAVNLEHETAKFRDHTFKAAISDWPGAWRNWIRKAAEFIGATAARAQAQPPPSFRERDTQAAAARVAEMTGGLVVARTSQHRTMESIDAPEELG